MEICKAPQEGAHNPQTEEGTIYPSIYLSVSFIRGLRTGRCPQCTQEKCGVLHSAHWGWGLWHCGRTSRSPSDMCELLCKVHAPQTPAPLRLSDPELFIKSCSECSLCSLCPQLTPNWCREYFLLFTPCSLLLPWLQEVVPSAVVFSWPFPVRFCSTAADEGTGCHPCAVRLSAQSDGSTADFIRLFSI